MTPSILASPLSFGIPQVLPRFASDRVGPLLLGLVATACAASPVVGVRASVATLSAVAFGAAIVGFFRPSLGLLAVGLLCTLDAFTRTLVMTGGLLRWHSFNYLLVIMVMLSLPVVLRPHDRQTRILLALVLLMSLGMLPSAAREAGLHVLLSVVSAFGVLLSFIRARRDERAFFWIAAINGTAAAGVTLAFLLEMSRLPYINANAWSYVPLAGLFSICLGFRFAESPLGRNFLLALTVVNTAWVFLSGSRGSMAVALVCLIYLFARARTPLLLLSGAIGAVFVMLTPLQFEDRQNYAVNRVTKLFDDSRSLKSRTSGRSTLASAGVEIFLGNPFGSGTGAFTREISGFIGHNKKAHSAWISTAVDNGFLGLFTFAAYVASFAMTGWRKRRQGLWGLGLFVSVALAVAFCSTEFVSKGLWLLAAGGTVLLNADIYLPWGRGRRDART